MVSYVDTYIYGQPNITGLLLSPAMQQGMQLESIEPLKY
jgi:hypothetical protein